MQINQKEFLAKINQGRTFTYLPILDWYIFREFMIPFSILTFTFILLFLIGDVFSDLGQFLDAKVPNTTILALRYFALKIPGNIRFVLPISVLLSCMYTIANLGRYREVTAMRCAGISMVRCGGAIYIAALTVTFINFWFNEQIVPECTIKSTTIYKRLRDPNYVRNMYYMLQYRSPDKMRDWLFENFNTDEKQQIIILKQYKLDHSGKPFMHWDLQAKSAICTDKGWTFYDVRKTDYNPIIHIPGAAREYKSLSFTRKEIPENIDSIRNAAKPADDLSSLEIIRILQSNPTMVPTLRATYKTILYYRLSFPWTCFLCVFLGLPLAVKNERSGIFLSIVMAVAAIVIFQVLTEISLVLGKQGYIPPIIGGTAPVLLFALYTYFFVIRKAT